MRKGPFLSGLLMTFLLTLSLSISARRINHYQETEKKLEAFLKDPSIKGYESLETIFEKQIELMGAENLAEWDQSGGPSLFLDVIKVYFPHLFPENHPGRAAYHRCFESFYPFSHDLSNASLFSVYKNCLVLGFRFEKALPENYKKLLKALEKLSRPS